MNKETNEINNNVTDSGDVDLFSLLRDFCLHFKKIWWTAPVFAVTLAVIVFAYFRITFVPMYKSTVRFTITPLVSSNSQSGASVYNFNYNTTLATQMANTFPYIMKSGILADIISNDMGKPINGSISSTAITDTNIFEVSVVSNSAKDAYDIVNSLIVNYPKVAEYVVGDTRMQVIEGSEPVLATEPFNAGYYYKYVVFAAILGILISIAITVMRMYFKKTIKSRRDIETKLNGKCICEIPVVERKRSHSSKLMLRIGTNSPGFLESVRVLKQRTRSIMKADGSKIVGITSTEASEGKTTVAYNLAKALSNGTDRVLLIDMDMHNRSVQSYLNRKKEISDIGITDVVAHKVTIDGVINSISDTFDVIFAGCQNSKFIKSDYTDIFAYVRDNYDYIVVDLPTCGLASETASIADLCDQVMFVIKWNATSPEKVYNSITYMAFSNAKMMGFVLNAVERDSSDYNGYKYYGGYGKRRYGYGYGYGYGNGNRAGYGKYGAEEGSGSVPSSGDGEQQ